jgi:hypothetical protein
MANMYRGKVNVLHKTNKEELREGWRFSNVNWTSKREMDTGRSRRWRIV